MTTLIIVRGAVLAIVLVAMLLLFRLAKQADAAAEANARAEKAEHDAFLQKKYAEIATAGRDADGTAGVLDQGKFFLPPAEGVHPRATEESRGRNQGDA